MANKSAYADLTGRLASLKMGSLRPRRSADDDDEELGLAIDSTTVAGGGRRAQSEAAAKAGLRVGRALRHFLAEEGVIPRQDAAADVEDPQTPPPGPLRNLLVQPHIRVPAELTDRGHPLPEYFISSSHNTYLMAHQLYGDSSAQAYQTALRAGARCVEVDAWDNEDNKDEPKVTHGYTLVSNIPFRVVCETIRDVADGEAAEHPRRGAPVLLSLENHCEAHGQRRLAQIMTEVFGDRLLSAPVRRKGHEEQRGGEHVRLEELGSKIVVIIEYHFPEDGDEGGGDDDSSSGSGSDQDEDEKKARRQYEDQKKNAPSARIVPELAGLGIYAQSVKPADDSWFQPGGLQDGPHHHLVNVSESGLSAIMPLANPSLGQHNAHNLMRVYPKGARISSRNLHPVSFWGIGAQICALNWQSFDASMQLNEALFSGSDGFVLKPAQLRAGGDGFLTGLGRRKRLRLRVVGATDVPVPPEKEDVKDFRPYVTCSLVLPNAPTPVKRKTGAYRQHRLAFLHLGENPPATDPVWDETLEWEYEDSELAFLRVLIKSDDRFARNEKVAVAAMRVSYLQPGWRFVGMLDLRGRETRCSLLVKFDLEDA